METIKSYPGLKLSSALSATERRSCGNRCGIHRQEATAERISNTDNLTDARWSLLLQRNEGAG